MSRITIAPDASGTAVFTVASPATNTSRVVTLPDATTTLVGTDATQTLTNKTLTAPVITGGSMSGTSGVITSGTAVATTSGSSVTFTGIPSWAKRITVMFAQVSAAADINFLVRIGDGAITTSGYVSTAMAVSGANATNSANDSSGFVIFSPGASGSLVGHMVLTLITANAWVSSHTGIVDTSNGRFGGGVKSLTGALDRVSLVLNGATTFDGGTVNIMYEG